MMDKRLISVDISSTFLSVRSHLLQVVDSIHDYISAFHEQGSVRLFLFHMNSKSIMIFL